MTSKWVLEGIAYPKRKIGNGEEEKNTTTAFLRTVRKTRPQNSQVSGQKVETEKGGISKRREVD